MIHIQGVLLLLRSFLLSLQAHKNCQNMTEIEAKVSYVKLARSLKTYGVSFFLVKVRRTSSLSTFDGLQKSVFVTFALRLNQDTFERLGFFVCSLLCLLHELTHFPTPVESYQILHRIIFSFESPPPCWCNWNYTFSSWIIRFEVCRLWMCIIDMQQSGSIRNSDVLTLLVYFQQGHPDRFL